MRSRQFKIASAFGLLSVIVVGLVALLSSVTFEATADRHHLYDVVTGVADQITTESMKVEFTATMPGKNERQYNLSVDYINERISEIDADIANLQSIKTFWEDCRTTVVAQLP